MKTQVNEKTGSLFGRLLRSLPAVAVSVMMFGQAASAEITTLASGMLTPESISIAPSTFGSYGGDYFIPDAGRITSPDSGSVWRVKSDGSASQFAIGMASGLPNHSLGGLFLPSSGWGSESGKFLVAGYTEAVDPTADVTDPNRHQHSYLTAFDSSGNSSTLLDYLHEGGASTLCDPIIAPGNFGAHGGDLIVTDQQGNLLWVRPNENVQGGYEYGELVDFVNDETVHNGFNPFGITLASDSFGAVGGTLLVSESSVEAGYSGPRIVSVDSSGNVADFATVSVFNGQMRLRQMAMAPEGFLSGMGIDGQVLLVSLTASQYGGGLGTLLALDSTGEVVAHLKVGTELAKFDPRGILVLGDGTLLISDASDPIITAQGKDFAPGAPTAVPEPSSMIALIGGLGSLLAFRRRRP